MGKSSCIIYVDFALTFTAKQLKNQDFDIFSDFSYFLTGVSILQKPRGGGKFWKNFLFREGNPKTPEE